MQVLTNNNNEYKTKILWKELKKRVTKKNSLGRILQEIECKIVARPTTKMERQIQKLFGPPPPPPPPPSCDTNFGEQLYSKERKSLSVWERKQT